MPSSNEIALGTRIREDTPLSDVDLGKGLFIYYVIADGGSFRVITILHGGGGSAQLITILHIITNYYSNKGEGGMGEEEEFQS